ncbi:acetoacetyl-CoA synthetase [Pseudarthrobacter enclensis]|uniref:acetoacetate--CoA ligase n=1 Tax=Pseudarthrobacter enclensis TaxID=993070 RepID=UPI000815E0B9|nr:acetoacetate--CoA ligase [Pseudarthrobacter enclensis]SCC30100.1 acetoacetyl-CoA synthetase [Pseudarthrobacter enclensis]
MIVDKNAAEGAIIWRPDENAISDTSVARFTDFAQRHGAPLDGSYDSLWKWSTQPNNRFWELFAEFAGITMGGVSGAACSSNAMPGASWFPGRTVNYARHLLEGREGIALLSVTENNALSETSWEVLRGKVGALAAHLRSTGVRAGDRVVAVLPNVEEAVVGLLATASMGAVWSICSPEFGPGAISSRFAQLSPKVMIASPGYRLGGRDRDRRAEVEEVLTSLTSVEHVVWVTTHTDTPVPETALPCRNWNDITAHPAEPAYEDLNFDHPLWVLFSSGTTGIPKGIVHGHGGALIEMMKMLLIHCDLRPEDRFLSIASTSWVVWNALVSTLGAGATAVLVDGNPTFPSVDRVWELAALTGATALGVSAGFIHACAKKELVPSQQHDLSRLKFVQVTGSPLSSDGYRWVYACVGDVWLSSVSGGTDIASIFVGGIPCEPVRVGYIQAPALGVNVQAWDADGAPAEGTGELVVTKPLPSMPLYFWGDNDGSRYRASYFDMYPGVWRHGDFIEFNAAGIKIHGRSDSTLNRNGLRLGSAEIYAVVESLPEIAEALVVGAEIGAEDYYMPLFVQLTDGVNEETARQRISAAIREHLSVRYLPDDIVAVRGIPHTRTGKKLEVPVKRLLQGEPLERVADLGSLDDPALMEEFAAFAAARSGKTEHLSTIGK